MARHNATPGQPGPVRDKLNIYGYQGNTPQQQAEADKGTRMAVQAGDIYQELVKACEARRVPPLATLENPPGSEESGGAWDLPELQKALEETHGVKVPYHSCAFMARENNVFSNQGFGQAGFQELKSFRRSASVLRGSNMCH